MIFYWLVGMRSEAYEVTQILSPWCVAYRREDADGDDGDGSAAPEEWCWGPVAVVLTGQVLFSWPIEFSQDEKLSATLIPISQMGRMRLREDPPCSQCRPPVWDVAWLELDDWVAEEVLSTHSVGPPMAGNRRQGFKCSRFLAWGVTSWTPRPGVEKTFHTFKNAKHVLNTLRVYIQFWNSTCGPLGP